MFSTAFFPGSPGTIVADDIGSFLVGDAGVRVRRVRLTSAGNYAVTTVAGNGTVGFSGDGGFATASMLFQPFAVTHDANGGVFVADYQNCVSEYCLQGLLFTCYSIGLLWSTRVKISRAVRRVFANGNISTVVGAGPTVPGSSSNCGSFGMGGPGTLARIRYPRGIVTDGSGGVIFRQAYDIISCWVEFIHVHCRPSQ